MLLMAEPIVDYYWSGYQSWADKYVSRKVRTSVAIGISVLALLWSGFLAFNDQYDATLKVTSDRDYQHGRAEYWIGVATERANQINSLEAKLAAKPKEIVRYVAGDKVTAADPDTLYQDGHAVGTVVAPRTDFPDGVITFEELDGTSQLDRTRPFKYRNFILRLVGAKREIGMLTTPTGTKSGVLQGVTCKILKR